MNHAVRGSLRENGILLKDHLFQRRNSSFASCFGCLGLDNDPEPTLIPYADILRIEQAEEGDIRVTFAKKKGNHLEPESALLNIDCPGVDDVIQYITEKSYPGTKPGKTILVLVNPHGGQGKAIGLFVNRARPILDAAGCHVEVHKTTHHKHAIEIVKNMDVDQFDVIACASGDGVPHEVFNGLYSRPDRVYALNNIAVTQLPCGSGNAMSESCYGTNEASYAALSLIKSHLVNIDLMALTQNGKTSVSFLSQTVGVIAAADLGTEHLRFLGPLRFELGVLDGVLRKKKVPCDIAIKYSAKSKDALRERYDRHTQRLEDKHFDITEESLRLKYDPDGPIPDDWEVVDPDVTSNMGIFYTGKMPYISRDTNFFPAALPNDGSFDIIMIDSRTSIARQVPILLSIDTGGHVHAAEVQHSKALAYRLTPRKNDGYLSVDGEKFPFEELQVEILPGAAKTLMRNGMFRQGKTLNQI
jgi:sphingosine kinase